MKFFMLVPLYISWHYTTGFVSWIHNLMNFIVFEFRFFSVLDLLKTLFAPFQRLKERNTNGPMDIENILSVLVVNIVMRLVGLFVRLVILVLAAICITLSVLFALVSIIFWLLLPFILLALTIGSSIAYFKYKP